MKPLPLNEWNKSLGRIVADMGGRPLNIHALLANHPALLDAWWGLRNYLVNGGDLGRRHCELVILRVAVHEKNWYEWASHVVRGMASGLTLDEIERVRDRSGNWSPEDVVLLDAADDVMQANAIGAAALEGLVARFSERQVLDLVHICGMYRTIACAIATWGLELDEHVAERLPPSVTEKSFTR